MNKCANNTKTNCPNFISQKGTIFCESCLTVAKTQSKNKRESHFEELLDKIKKMEKDLEDEKNKNLNYTEKISKLEKNNTNIEDLQLILGENKKLKDIILKLRLENEALASQRETYINKYNQLRIDYQKINLENINLKIENEKKI